MATYFYLSNISPMWPLELQERMLTEAVPTGTVILWRDALSPAERRRHKSQLLLDRKNMLRPTTRKSQLTIYVASLAVVAWTMPDMLVFLTEAMKRAATIRVLDTDLTIQPDAGPDVLQKATEAFARGRRSRLGMSAGKVGGKISAERRSAAAKAKADTVKPFWHLPSSEHPTAALVKRSGVSLNTLKLHHGPRPAAQRAYEAAQKRRQKKEQTA